MRIKRGGRNIGTVFSILVRDKNKRRRREVEEGEEDPAFYSRER